MIYSKKNKLLQIIAQFLCTNITDYSVTRLLNNEDNKGVTNEIDQSQCRYYCRFFLTIKYPVELYIQRFLQLNNSKVWLIMIFGVVSLTALNFPPFIFKGYSLNSLEEITNDLEDSAALYRAPERTAASILAAAAASPPSSSAPVGPPSTWALLPSPPLFGGGRKFTGRPALWSCAGGWGIDFTFHD
jgi:hypothetical protein